MSYGVNVPLDAVVKALNLHMKGAIEGAVRHHLNEALAPVFEEVVKEMTNRIHASITRWDEQQEGRTGKTTVNVQLSVDGQPRKAADVGDGN